MNHSREITQDCPNLASPEEEVSVLPLPSADSVFRHSLQATLVLFLMLLPCRAQQSAQTWTGTVRNANGAPVSGARIQLAAEGAHTELVQATSGADGSFQVGPVRPGQYRLSLQLSSSTGEAVQLVLAPLKAVSVSFVVQAGGESLTVMPGVRRAGAQIANSGGEELSSHEVSSLPLNKRDFSQLLLLAAGTMTDANGATNFTQRFAINGQRGVEATFAMDGADTTDPDRQ